MALIWVLATRDTKVAACRGACSLVASWTSRTLPSDERAPSTGVLSLVASAFQWSSSSFASHTGHRSYRAQPMTTLRPPSLPSGRKRHTLPPSPVSSELSDIQDAGDDTQPSCSYEPDLKTTTTSRRQHLPKAQPWRSSDCSGKAPTFATPQQTAAEAGVTPGAAYHYQPSQLHHKTQQTHQKSAKRRAAEALLAVRFGSSAAVIATDGCCQLHTTTATATTYIDTTRLTFHSCGSAGYSDGGAAAGHASAAAASHSLSDDSTDTAQTKGCCCHSGSSSQGAARPNPCLAAPQPQQHPSLPHLVQRQAHPHSHPHRHSQPVTRALGMSTTTTTSPSCPSSPQGQEPQPPAAKRARLSLAATTSLGGKSAGGGVGGAKPPRPPPITVSACDPDRGCKAKLLEGQQQAAGAGAAAATTVVAASNAAVTLTNGGGGAAAAAAAAVVVVQAESEGGAAAGAAGAASPGPVWCSFEVKVPSLNWQAVFDEPPGALQRFGLARGYEKLVLPEGLVSYLVENPRHVEDALLKLRASMQDRVIAIDLEWRPETVAGRTSPVALMQLSTASTSLLLRTSCMGYSLPAPVADFLADPSLVVLGFGWDSADEAKMSGTFGMGRARFRKFLDLQEVAASMGYHGFGLARLAAQVLGVPMHKAKSVSRSNWAAPQLTSHQLKYASLDVFVAGQLFRALRLWHSSPSPCAACRHPIGEPLQLGPLRCGEPSCAAKPAADLIRHNNHCAHSGHPPRYGACPSCGRVHELASAVRQQR